MRKSFPISIVKTHIFPVQRVKHMPCYLRILIYASQRYGINASSGPWNEKGFTEGLPLSLTWSAIAGFCLYQFSIVLSGSLEKSIASYSTEIYLVIILFISFLIYTNAHNTKGIKSKLDDKSNRCTKYKQNKGRWIVENVYCAVLYSC